MSADSAPVAVWEGREVASLAAEWQLPGLLVYETVSSTNDIARTRAAAGAPAGLLVLAEHQTAGRGRHGRTWHAHAHCALLLSFVLRPRAATHTAAGSAPLRVGLAVARALRSVTAARPLLKWPNDLITRAGAKLGGVLCEATTNAAGEGVVVAGIGINVRPHEASHADAVSLDEMSGSVCNRLLVLEAIVREMRPLLDRPLAPLSPAELAEYRSLDALAGRDIVVHMAGESLLARADGIDADGALRIFGPHGTARVTSATVRLADHSATGTMR